jgi:hypothetical protein
MAVQKSGRTTGHTTGAVAATNATIFVRYDATCGGGRGFARFANQIRVTPGTFSGAGDSGSLVVDTSTPPRAVGLLFAGSSSSTFANPIDGVLGAFGVTLVGASSSAQAPWSGWLGGWLGRSAPAPAPAQRIDPGWLAAARQARQRHEDAVLAIQGVLGLGVGASEQTPGEAAVEVYVARDTSAVRRQLPRWLDGVGVKVVETGEIVARTQACAAE